MLFGLVLVDTHRRTISAHTIHIARTTHHYYTTKGMIYVVVE